MKRDRGRLNACPAKACKPSIVLVGQAVSPAMFRLRGRAIGSQYAQKIRELFQMSQSLFDHRIVAAAQ